MAASGSREARRNRDITAREVRLIGADGQQVGVVPLRKALEEADEAGMDLVEISPNTDPPVCKIMDFGKFKFEQAKKLSQAKKNQKQIQIKEIKFRPGTDEGDYQIKLKRMQQFLEAGDKVKVTLRFRGREMAHRDLGLQLLRRVNSDLAELGVAEQQPQLEGRQMVMVLAPKKR